MSQVITQVNAINDAGDIVVNRVQDVSKHLDYAHGLRNAEGFKQSADMKLAAEFPDVVVENYINRTGITYHEFLKNPEHVKRMLCDPALKGFRVWEGRV